MLISIQSYDPTIEDSYRKQMVIDEIPCVLEVLDTAGQEEYSALRDQWIRSSFERIQSFIIQIARVKGAKSTAIVLVGNKSDLANEREVTYSEGETISNLMGCGFAETSAKRRSNVDYAFASVARMIRALSKRNEPAIVSKPNTSIPLSSAINIQPPSQDTSSKSFQTKKKKKRFNCIIL
ncbi:Protein ras-2 [Smittium culicis]|uniref:Protein ras-2 n=1 Tax=Smittium culicis TaxID=133412 RepID=A0A1R1YQX6_9FUNG|nr:Protein ras-2 [Smittium culicis]